MTIDEIKQIIKGFDNEKFTSLFRKITESVMSPGHEEFYSTWLHLAILKSQVMTSNDPATKDAFFTVTAQICQDHKIEVSQIAN